MKRFKKGVALIISAVMMLSMAACGKEEVKNHPGERSTRDSIISTVDRTTGTDFTTEPTETETTDVTSTDTTATVATTEQPINVDPDTEKAFKQFEDDFFKYVMESSYIQYHYTIKDGTKFDIEKPDPVWGEVEWSDEAVEKDRKEEEDWMNKLKAIDRDGLSETAYLMTFIWRTLRTAWSLTNISTSVAYFRLTAASRRDLRTISQISLLRRKRM